MSTSQVIIDFSAKKYKDADLPTKAINILNHLTDNPNFPAPIPSLNMLKVAIDQYVKSLSKSGDGSKANTSIKKKDRVILEKTMQRLGTYVQLISEGDRGLILKSGFDVNKERSVIGPLDQPSGFTVAYGSNCGEIILECDKINNAKDYQFEYTQYPLTPDRIWHSISCSKRKLFITGLTSNQIYMFRVAAKGTHPSRNWSEPIRKLVP